MSKRPPKNKISIEQHAELRRIFLSESFSHQRTWYQAGQTHKVRNILKSRMIGASDFFGREAFIDALDTGQNQIFLSADDDQAQHIKQYIIQFAKKAGVELKGENIVLPNQATLFFPDINTKTGMVYQGNLYMDEIFWMEQFKHIQTVGSAMAALKKFKKTFFSTPSDITHDAYSFWSGQSFNARKPVDKQITIDISHETLVNGKLCADGQWRQIVTIEDAARSGFDLFTPDDMRSHYTEAEFLRLFMCEFTTSETKNLKMTGHN